MDRFFHLTMCDSAFSLEPLGRCTRTLVKPSLVADAAGVDGQGASPTTSVAGDDGAAGGGFVVGLVLDGDGSGHPLQ